MVDKFRRLFEIYEITENPREVVIFTSSFKARGKLLTDKGKIKDELITLKDAVVCPPFEKCQCEEHAQYYEWLNIFADDVLSFTILT